MRKRYGVAMNTYGYLIPGAARIAEYRYFLKKAKGRLKWVDWYASHGRNGRATCRHFGLSPDVFCRWKNRYNPGDLATLEDDVSTRTPCTLRQPETDPELMGRVKYWREKHPR